MTAHGLPLVLRSRHGSYWRPSSLDATSDEHRIASEFSAPLGRCHRNAIMGDEQVSSCVSGLLSLARPSAVFWFIVSVVVNALNRGAWIGLRAHVGQKSLKAVAPSVAYRNAASPIQAIGWIRRITTARLHAGPCSIFRPSSHAVGRIASPVRVSNPASATVGYAARQAAHVDLFDTATAATADKVSMVASFVAFMKNGPCAEYVAGRWCHMGYFTPKTAEVYS